MARLPLWKSIAATLRDEIAETRYGPGDKLPTEAALAARFGVNRHTARRALADLAAAGLVEARRGSGVYVTQQPAEYPLGRRVRFHRNLAAAGRVPGRQLLHLETRGADPDEAAALALAPGDPVHVYEGLSHADGQAIAHFTSSFPATRFADLPEALRASGSVTEAFAACGLGDYTRAGTRLTARAATPTQARLLGVPQGAPLLRSQGVNVDPAGVPVEYGRTFFVGERVTLTLDGG